MIKVIIADDQKLFRESIKSILELDEEFEVIGCVENGLEAAKLCQSSLPDIILMDIKMPVCDGIQATKLIKSQYPEIKIMILTMIDEDKDVCKALENLADGYILKDCTPAELKQFIKNVAHGFNIISKKIYDTFIREWNRNNESQFLAAHDETLVPLKENELHIIRYIADGKNNKDIAALLHLSEGRIKNIITKLLNKLDLKDRYQLLSYAFKNNLIK